MLAVVYAVVREKEKRSSSSGGSRGDGAWPPLLPTGGLAINVLVHLTTVMTYQLVNLSFIISGHINGHIWQLHQYCENSLQMENKSQEILHHLGTQKMQNYA